VTIAWVLFAVYLVATTWLAWRGGKLTGDAAEFAIGGGRMNPWLVGVTLGACLASSATFVIFPGWVYAEGLAALIGFTLPFLLGIGVGLWLLAPRFQAIGASEHALTLPHWMGARYRDPVLRRLFSALGLLQVAYLILITVGCATVMEKALGLPYQASVVGVVVFVFGYTAFGGSYAHALTNGLQGAVMLVMAVVIFASGWRYWLDGSVVAELVASGTTAPGSVLFSTPWEVWGVSFAMGAALTTQPHLLTKALYVRGPRALTTVVVVGVATYTVYALVLFAGAYARIALPDDLDRKVVVATYIATAMPWPWLAAAVSVAILAASMSTLDGLLVAISTSVSNDLLPGRGTVWLNRIVMVGLAVVTVGASLTPPALVLTVGQMGVYGLVAASAGPLLVGLFVQGPLDARWARVAPIVAVGVHFGALFGGVTANPGVAAVMAIAASLPLALLAAVGQAGASGAATERAQTGGDPPAPRAAGTPVETGS
jgi:sodium/pantothenate symporter